MSKHGIPLLQTKSKLADDLVKAGLLSKERVRPNGPWLCAVDGYALTDAGRAAYCLMC